MISNSFQVVEFHHILLKAIKQKLHMKSRVGEESPLTDVEQEEDKKKMLLGAKVLVSKSGKYCHPELSMGGGGISVMVTSSRPSFCGFLIGVINRRNFMSLNMVLVEFQLDIVNYH